MKVDWEEVEKLVKPSTSFDVLIKDILTVLEYDFVKEFYDMDMQSLKEYTEKLLGCDSRERYLNYIANLNTIFSKLNELNVENVVTFIKLIESKVKFIDFYKKSNIEPAGLIRVLKYMFNWFLPSKTYLRELIAKENQKQIEYVKTLREFGIRFTLDILEKCKSKEMRNKIAKETRVPEIFISELVNRADFTRMPYIRGKTIIHYFSIGYNSLEKLANADLKQLEKEMRDYLEKQGVKLSRSFIELDSGIEISKILPKIVEN
jgi:hypothetical protein